MGIDIECVEAAEHAEWPEECSREPHLNFFFLCVLCGEHLTVPGDGKEGVAITPLRPAGTALIEGERINVVTEGAFVERDSSVTVVEVEGNRVVVQPL